MMAQSMLSVGSLWAQLSLTISQLPIRQVTILITFTKETLVTYFILEDSRYPGVWAAFRSHGHGVCFHPDGQLW